jgi:AraC-like DNA-binding protein
VRAIAENVTTDILREQFIPDHVFIYIAKGAIRIFDGSRNYMIKAGNAFIARKNRLAKYELLSTDEALVPVLFCFDEPFLKKFQEKHAPVRSDRQIKDAFIEIRNNRLISSFIESIKPYYRCVMALDEDFEDVKYEELLIILLKTHPEISSFLFDFAPPEKINLEAFMNKNFTFNVGVERFATLTGRSISAFKRDFKEIYHQPPSQWLMERRLREAYLLISKKRQKPADIYLDLGFKSLSHFSVAFKKQFHCTPSELGNGK